MKNGARRPDGSTARLGRALRLISLACLGIALVASTSARAMTSSGGNPRPHASWRQLPLKGEQKWLTLLCRFDGGPIPHKPRWYRTLMGTGRSRVPAYWKEISFGKMTIDGSRVAGWYRLGKPVDAYMEDSGILLQQKVADDCMKKANRDLFLPRYDGVAIWTNHPISHESGWRARKTFDNKTKRYFVALPSSATHQAMGALTRSMGFAFGWSFSYSDDTFQEKTASFWDPMSGMAEGCHFPDHPEWCRPVHPIAQWKYLAGWVPSANRVEVLAGEARTVLLHPLEQKPPAGGKLAIAIPIENSQVRYLTVEVRKQVGFDARPEGTMLGLPGSGVLIHRMDSYNSRSVVLDGSPGDGYVDNEAAARKVGDSFHDTDTGVTVDVLERKPSGAYVVRVKSPSLPVVSNDDFADATVLAIPASSHGITSYAATTEAEDPLIPCTNRTQGHTTWYRFTSPTDGYATFGSDSRDLTVSAYVGRHGNLRNFGCALWSGDDRPPRITALPVRQGVTYHFEAASTAWWEGTEAQVDFAFTPGAVVPTTHHRYLSLKLEKHLIAKGRVFMDEGWFGACTQRVRVKIFHINLRKHERTLVATPRTDDRGRYRVRVNDRPGHYEAHIDRAALHGHTCEGWTASTPKHEH